MGNAFTHAVLVAGVALVLIGCDARVAKSPDMATVAQSLCALANDGVKGVPGISVSNHAPNDELPYLSIRLTASKDEVLLYYAPELRAAAESKAECFGSLLALLRREVPATPREMHWAPLVITTADTYIPKNRTSDETRWHVSLPEGAWDEQSIKFLTLVMPHEEVHQSQRAQRKLTTPRWFHEGHAEWAALKVTDQVRPDLSSAERTRYFREASKLMPNAHLASWGGIKPKKEAIERQLSAEDRVRLKTDPTFQPSGPFTFGPDDLVQDDLNEPGRYGAALKLFERLEREHGKKAVLAWVRRVLESKDNAQIVPLGEQVFGENLSGSLK